MTDLDRVEVWLDAELMQRRCRDLAFELELLEGAARLLEAEADHWLAVMRHPVRIEFGPLTPMAAISALDLARSPVNQLGVAFAMGAGRPAVGEA